ncbi:MAG: rhomboid family intramembrane serine protease [Bacteroidales bacterium]|nr:MAG: rhomboid family intramembrane serine protease [Bacteroidales bacterium]
MADWGKNKENITKFITSFNENRNVYSEEELAQKYEELKPSYVSKEEDILNQAPPTTKEKLTGFLSIFKPTQGYFITPILINLNIAIFILMAVRGVNIFLPDNESLISWGANFRPVTLEGEWWRLFTCCFLHIGIFHLLMNMYALLYIGLLLEPHLGKTRFLTTYLLTGIAASVTSLWWHDLTISAGASGAIFGMYGVFLAMLTTNLIEKSARKALLTSIAIFVGYNLLNGLKGGIDNAAHIGGLISGIIIGYSFVPSLKENENLKLKYTLIAILSAVILFTSTLVYKNITPYEFTKYDARMKEFVAWESMALEMFKMPEDTPNEKYLHEIKTRSLYYWNENIKLVKEVDILNLPSPVHERNKKLLKYCEFRVESCNLIYKAIEENTQNYRTQIEDINKQIETIINELTGNK